MSSNLYSLPSEGAEFTRVCGGNLTSDHEACFELAALPGANGALLVRDSKNPAAGHLAMTVEEVDALAANWPAMRDKYIA